MRISVTKKHIRNGEPSMPDLCPVALALGEALGETVYVVGDLYRREDGPYVELPKKVQNFVTAFDSGVKVQPFTFSIRGK